MAEPNSVVNCQSVDAWNDHFQKGKDSKKLVVVDFTATWCGPCRLIAPILANLAIEKPEVVFLKVDVDDLKTVAEEWKVDAMPTFLFFKEGKVIDRIVGAKKDELAHKVHIHSSAPLASV